MGQVGASNHGHEVACSSKFQSGGQQIGDFGSKGQNRPFKQATLVTARRVVARPEGNAAQVESFCIEYSGTIVWLGNSIYRQEKVAAQPIHISSVTSYEATEAMISGFAPNTPGSAYHPEYKAVAIDRWVARPSRLIFRWLYQSVTVWTSRSAS